jgi:transcriptional regulator with XRE-family HTH domain
MGRPRPSATTPYNLQLGRILRELRQRRGLSLARVEARSGGAWKESVVGSYERADRGITVERFRALVTWYGGDYARLIPAAYEVGIQPGAERSLDSVESAERSLVTAESAVDSVSSAERELDSVSSAA